MLREILESKEIVYITNYDTQSLYINGEFKVMSDTTHFVNEIVAAGVTLTRNNFAIIFDDVGITDGLLGWGCDLSDYITTFEDSEQVRVVPNREVGNYRFEEI